MPSQLIIIGGGTHPRYSLMQDDIDKQIWHILENGRRVIATCDGEASARCICGLLNRQRQALAPKRFPVIIGEVGLS